MGYATVRGPRNRMTSEEAEWRDRYDRAERASPDVGVTWRTIGTARPALRQEP